MATVPPYPPPPEDVVNTKAEVDAYHRDMQRSLDEMRDRMPDPGDE